MANPHPNMSGLTPFSSTYQPKKKGRKPSLLKKYNKTVNFSNYDLQKICVILATKKKFDDLKNIIKDKEDSLLVYNMAMAMIKDISKGKTDTMRWLLERAFGQSVQPMQIEGNMDITTLTQEQRKKRIDELLTKRNNEKDEPESK